MKTKVIVAFSVLAIVLAVSLASHAQTTPPAEPPSAMDSTAPPQEPGGAPFQLGGDQAIPMPDTTLSGRSLRSESFFSSPTGTLLKSVAFPGWGQWANGKKQKAVVYFGIESYFITKALIWRHRARTADSFTEFSHAQDRRNYFYWLTGITVFVSMFDAYADRYLLTLERTRDEGEDFWGTLPKQRSPDNWSLAITIRF
jgi:hypothetical protein